MNNNIDHNLTLSECCYVCGEQEVVGTYSSGIAPISGSICDDCLNRGAENLEVVHTWIFEYGGIDTAPDFSLHVKSFHDGKYIAWPKITELYPKYETEIRERIQRNSNGIMLVDVSDD